MTTQTHTVLSAYQGRDGVQRVYVRGHQGALIAETPLQEGAAVRIVGDRALPAQQEQRS